MPRPRPEPRPGDPPPTVPTPPQPVGSCRFKSGRVVYLYRRHRKNMSPAKGRE